MSSATSIEWTDTRWNPVRGCSRVSEGCRNCYAERQAARFTLRGKAGPGASVSFDAGPFFGFVKRTTDGPRWTGRVELIESKLAEPLSWRKPRRVFVNSMSDLFHEALPDEAIDRVFAVMALAPQHTFQVLTKRPERMREYMVARSGSGAARARMAIALGAHPHDLPKPRGGGAWNVPNVWPLPNVWLGVSVEDQATADERIPLLLDTPAAVRFVSAEPLLANVTLRPEWIEKRTRHHLQMSVSGALRNKGFDGLQTDDGRPLSRAEAELQLKALHNAGVKLIRASSDCDTFSPQTGCPGHEQPRIDWLIVGGESGPGARPCDVACVRSLVKQARAASVPCFVKQLGANCGDTPAVGEWFQGRSCTGAEEAGYVGVRRLRDRKGGDPSEWPEDLRVREFPAAAGATR